MVWIWINKLKLSPYKLEMLTVHRRAGLGMAAQLDDIALPLKEQVHNLGVLLDPALLTEGQVAAMAKKYFCRSSTGVSTVVLP